MSDLDDIKKFLDSASDKVRQNVTIVTPEDLGQDFLLHVSTNTNIREFIPFIGKRQADTEDRTTPRVCTAPTILGCMSGYGMMEFDFMERVPGEKSSNGGMYKGGIKIYALPFTAALRPNGKLVYDGKHSDEHWLVAYNKATATYVPRTAGKAFYRAVVYQGRPGKQPMAEGTLYIEVLEEKGLRFGNGIFLNKGYWIIDGPMPNFTTMTWSESTETKVFKVREIEKAEYLSNKAAAADLLSHTGDIPAYVKW